MKRILLILAGVVGAFGSNAQTADREAEAMVNLIAIQTRDAIAKLVPVTSKDSVVFWSLFDEYLEKSAELEKSRIRLYEKTALSYGSLNAATADSLAHRYFDNRLAQEKTLQEYYEKIKTATNAVIAFEFYQAQVFILARVRVNIREVAAMYARYKQPARREQ